ncbi:MAG: zinc-ribbon domain-containing protein [Deltaproteobacteria bacterium]|nr:zinc-ribbon domain-containing protein [Deltaproteobacteria bacterium]
MKCPHCEEEIPGSPCPECGETAPDGANYCMACGFSLGREERVDSLEDENGLDLEDRVLCPDGTCTGIIVDGTCTDCGKAPGEKKTPAGE